ncbi:glycine cleavage H-protein-domain-containing protein [Dactylonectria macrodidyma]|uniref:Glycine cleavage system H protein n=1 Tax=Dactylonectria macrodidyma TaxID=307937 RepID=A0A9P9JIE6_9HYPO|nr:glycine cleavage H-protein-domain-containing protein [Dactylonectria macrodidyma]
MSSLFARQAWAAVSRTKPSSLRAPIKAAPVAFLAAQRRAFSISSICLERRFSKEHEWVELTGNNYTIGLTKHAASALGDVVYVELPEVGDAFEHEAPFGTVESVKAVSEVFTPIAGEIIEVNESLNDTPELVSEEPEGDGWLVKFQAEDLKSWDDLLSKEKYDEFVASEEH